MHALGPSHGRMIWASQTQPVSSHRAHFGEILSILANAGAVSLFHHRQPEPIAFRPRQRSNRRFINREVNVLDALFWWTGLVVWLIILFGWASILYIDARDRAIINRR